MAGRAGDAHDVANPHAGEKDRTILIGDRRIGALGKAWWRVLDAAGIGEQPRHLSVGRDPLQRVRPHIREPQAAFAPHGAFGEGEAARHLLDLRAWCDHRIEAGIETEDFHLAGLGGGRAEWYGCCHQRKCKRADSRRPTNVPVRCAPLSAFTNYDLSAAQS